MGRQARDRALAGVDLRRLSAVSAQHAQKPGVVVVYVELAAAALELHAVQDVYVRRGVGGGAVARVVDKAVVLAQGVAEHEPNAALGLRPYGLGEPSAEV